MTDMERPAWVTNEPQWINHCRKIRARSRDLIEGRIGVIQAARELRKLAFWVRAKDDPDFKTFVTIESESDHLPVGAVRNQWAPDALERKDHEIKQVEEQWRQDALRAAQSLLKKFA